MKVEKVYYHQFTTPYDEWFKILNILNLSNNTYEQLYINGEFFRDKLKELSKFHFSDKITYKIYNDYEKAIEYFYKEHTGLDIKHRGYLLGPKNIGNKSFFKIRVFITIVDRPCITYILNISDAIKLYIDTRCVLIARKIFNQVALWASYQPYKYEKELYNEIRKSFGIDKRITYHENSIDIERLTDIYIKYINKL